MSDEIRVNRPVMQNNSPEGMHSGMPHGMGPRKSMMPWVALLVVVVVILGAGVLFRDRLFPQSNSTVAGTTNEKSSGYQAVFLSNGQVYFGKLSNASGMYVTLKDIFYLQVTTPPLQGSQQDQAAQAAAQAQQQLSLVKLGSELHGPVDSMQINRDQILFYEDMKADGKVMEAIVEYKKNPNAGTQTPATGTTPPATTPAK